MKGIFPRPGDDLMVALTEVEICVLIKWHRAQPKRIAKIVGAKLCDLRSGQIFKTHRERKAIIDYAKETFNAHMDRAKGLQSILKS